MGLAFSVLCSLVSLLALNVIFAWRSIRDLERRVNELEDIANPLRHPRGSR